MVLLEVVIGIVFVMLLLSLLASTVMELVAGFLSLRGKQLIGAIEGMIGSDVHPFTKHPFYQQLSIGISRKSKPMPSYLNAGTFSSILLDILKIDSSEELEARLESMPEGNLKRVLQFLYRQTNGSIIDFKKKVEEWFNEVMDRASGSYKRNSQLWLICIGLGIAILFNADTINVYHNLSVNPTLREAVVNAATNYANTQPAPAPQGTVTFPVDSLGRPMVRAAIDSSRQAFTRIINENIGSLESPLGLGWSNVHFDRDNWRTWLYRVIGWIVTALAVSLGATFWFDLLKKLVNIRNSGPLPQQQQQGTSVNYQQATTQSGTTTSVEIKPGLTQPEHDLLESTGRGAAKAPAQKPKDSKDDKPKPPAKEEEGFG